jgi:hypothetical protein
MELMGLKSAFLIRKNSFEQSPPYKGLIQHHENVDLILMKKPTPSRKEPTVIILDP